MQSFVYRFWSWLILCFVLFFMTNFHDVLYLSFPGSLEYTVCHITNRLSRYQDYFDILLWEQNGFVFLAFAEIL